MLYKKTLPFVGLIVCLLSLSACTVTDLDKNGNPIIPKDPNAVVTNSSLTLSQIADKLWAPKVLPEATQDFVSWDSIKSQIIDQKMIKKRSVFVKLTGTIAKVDTSKLKGFIQLNVGGTPIDLQVGRIIRGNSIRDASKYVLFSNFENQIRFAQISRELNNRALASIGKPDPAWVGQKATVIAAITIEENTISGGVPIQMTLGGK